MNRPLISDCEDDDFSSPDSHLQKSARPPVSALRLGMSFNKRIKDVFFPSFSSRKPYTRDDESIRNLLLSESRRKRLPGFFD